MTTKSVKKLELYRSNLQHVQQMVADVTERDTLRNWQPPIDGEHIMKAFDIKPGKEIGIIKSEIRESILEGKIKNDFDEAFQLMIEIGKRIGLKPSIK